MWEGGKWVWKFVGVVTLVKAAAAFFATLWETNQETGDELRVKEAVMRAEAHGLDSTIGDNVIGNVGDKLDRPLKPIKTFWELLMAI